MPPAAAPWTVADIATFYQVARRTVDDWREDPAFPEPLELPGRTIRFWGEDIIAWGLAEFDPADPKRSRGVYADAA